MNNTNRTTQRNDEDSALKQFAIDLVAEAREGRLDPVIGRDEEIRRVLQILSRRTKNNPILIGEPGTGKTAIVEGLAQRIVRGDVPENLRDKRVFSLDMGALVAGAMYKGQFEDRLKNVVKEVTEAQGGIILFIDEIHTLVGAGCVHDDVGPGALSLDTPGDGAGGVGDVLILCEYGDVAFGILLFGGGCRGHSGGSRSDDND